MKLPLLWLHDYCRPYLEADALARALDLSGTKVEGITRHGLGDLDGYLVGRVVRVDPHPNADRLRVCSVDLGRGEQASIVCGAPNVAPGQTVAVAQPGALLLDGRRLARATLRGVVSEGMILAEDELGIGPDHRGIVVLDELPAGTPLADALPLASDVLELEITPNRPDCLGVYGLAREVHAVTRAPLAPPPWLQDPGDGGPVRDGGPIAGASVRVQAADLCPRFTARIFEDVRVKPSPPWLKARLMAAGQRPISNVVDITNFVMLLAGQPLHAFDLDRVAGGSLVVRRASPGESLVTLDGTRRELDEDIVVIADGEGVTSIAGIMGGERSEVSGSSCRVLMEAATWNGPNIQRTSQRLGLRSEASGRFEKGLSPDSALEAQALATRLMVELCDARLVPGTIDVGGRGAEPRVVTLRDARVTRLLGTTIPTERCREILVALGFAVGDAPGGLRARVPHWRRYDVSREADLVEEVARVHGLGDLPATLPARRGLNGGGARGMLTVAQRQRRRLEDALAHRGLSEIAGWSFADPGFVDRLGLRDDDPRRRVVRLANPMAEDQSVLRTTLLGSLLEAARRNLAHGAPAARLFDVGAVYLADGDGGLPHEPQHVAALLVGPPRPATWRTPDPPAADVFAVKGLLAGALDTLRVSWSVEQAAEPFLHPGRAGHVLVNGRAAGWLGELHPRVADAWDLGAAAGFELDLDAVLAAVPDEETYRDVTSFPAVRQDLAVIVGEGVPAARVLDVARVNAGTQLVGAEVFDVYRGEQVGAGRLSLALRLEFRAPDRTLREDEVSARVRDVAHALELELGARRRA